MELDRYRIRQQPRYTITYNNLYLISILMVSVNNPFIIIVQCSLWDNSNGSEEMRCIYDERVKVYSIRNYSGDSCFISTCNLSGFSLAQNKTSNMSKTGGNMANSTIANKTSFAGASNPTMAGKIANSTK